MKKFRDSKKNLIHQNAGGGENSIVRMHLRQSSCSFFAVVINLLRIFPFSILLKQ